MDITDIAQDTTQNVEDWKAKVQAKASLKGIRKEEAMIAAWKEKVKAVAAIRRLQKEESVQEQSEQEQPEEENMVPLESAQQIMSKQFSGLPNSVQQYLKSALKI